MMAVGFIGQHRPSWRVLFKGPRGLLIAIFAVLSLHCVANADTSDEQAIRSMYDIHDKLSDAVVFFDGKFQVDKSQLSGTHHDYSNADFLGSDYGITWPDGTSTKPIPGFLRLFSPQLTQKWEPNASKTLAERFSNETHLSQVSVDGDKAVVRATHATTLQHYAKDYTFVMLRAVEVREDRLERTSGGWRIEHQHVISASKPQVLASRASPIAMSQLRSMHDLNSMMRSFNENVNYSNCYYSNSMADKNETARVQACSP